MVGVSDIPILGKVVERISEAGADVFFLGLSYLFCYKKLVNELDTEINKVNIQENLVNQKCGEASASGYIIKDHVLTWQKEVKEFQESGEEFSKKYKDRASWTCLKCLPIPKPISRFQLGREAARTTNKATDLVNSGKEHLDNAIADPPPNDDLPNPAVEFENFASRKYVYGKLWEELVTEGSSLILGIYGMAGVGKTRMMEQLWKEAKEKNIFKKVVRANVGSEELDMIKLQDQIAADLTCRFDSPDNVKSRASQLKHSLLHWGKVLLILDDVWSEIPLDNIIGAEFCESSSSKGSKILLTSRSEYVCLQNKCKHPVQITSLTDEEAWDLFKETVGTHHIDKLQDDTLAKGVCAKCAGLPLLIHAVGKALKFSSHRIWTDALLKLENGDFNKIPNIDPRAYACVKLSIDRLQENEKLCLFLCSLFPEDADIHITTLIQFSMGSQLILNGESTIPAAVEFLTKSSLLLECYGNHVTKLHDIIRDVARFMASTDSTYAFLHEKCVSQLPENAGYRTSKLLRLEVEGDHVHFPEYRVSEHLNTLWLNCNNHVQHFLGGFFDMFVNLGFLILQNVHFLPEHFSLQLLGKLKTLIFDNCDMRETDVRLFPKKINTLCIWDCRLPSPLDLSNLNNLVRLDIQQELPEVVMVRNAIPSLSRLEEMHIPNGITFLDVANDVTLILDEISKLTCLRSLKISFRDFEPCQGTAVFKRLSKYDISAERRENWDRRENWARRENWEALPKSTKTIVLMNVQVKRDEGIQSLLERAEKVTLRSTDVDVSSIWKSNREAFTDLKELSIQSCDPLEYIARISRNEIQHIRQPRTSFSKLTMLTIKDCSAMKYLFCKSVAKCLGQLQELDIDNCPAMEAIVMDEGRSDGEIINLSKLRRLRLVGLKSLRSFYRGNKSVMSSAEFPPLFDEMVAFPSLDDLTIQYLGEHTTCIWGSSVSSTSFCKLNRLSIYTCNKLESVIPVSMLNRLHNLEYLNIEDCSRLRNAFPPCIARDLIRLEYMWIHYCGMMTEIIGGGDQQKEKEISDNEDHDIIMFPNLTDLNLVDLQNLTGFRAYQNWESNTCKVEFPCLETFCAVDCGEINLEAIDFGRGDSTYQLKSLQISSDKQMHLPCKWKLHLDNLEILELSGCWWRELKSLHFPNLKELEVNNCGRSALFTIPGFRSLKQLQTLKISDCDLLEEIVEDVRVDEHDEMDTKTIIELLQLHSVNFQNLRKLRSFMGGANYECYMPALTELEVNNCELSSLFFFGDLQQPESMKFSKLEKRTLVSLQSPTSFYRKKKEMDSISSVQFQPLFDGMVAFPSLNELIIEDLEITDIWGQHYSNDNVVSSSFCKLKRLSVEKCSKLDSVIPVSMLDRLQNLEYIDIEECSRLRNAFPPCIARDLKKLRISSCETMTEIIRGGDQHKEKEITTDHIIVFLELTKLELVNLKNLTNFWCHQGGECNTYTYKVQFPSLVDFKLDSCGVINLEAIELCRDDSTCPLKSISIKSENHLQLPRKWQLHLYTLEKLELRHCWWHELKSLCFPELKELQVSNCGRCALFTISGFGSLQQLETLEISNCDLLEEIVEDVRGDEHDEMDTKTVIELSQLVSVDFKDLPKLKSFTHGANYECHMPKLKKIHLLKCPQHTFSQVEFPCLETFCAIDCGETNLEAIDFGRGDSTYQLKILQIRSDKQMHLPCKWKLHLDNLEILELSGCWWRELKSLHFPNLKELQVNNCGRSALFTISGFRSLKQLQTLRISDCDLLEEIVEDVRGDEHDEMDTKTVIELSQLVSVDFKDLPKLKSFMGGANYECYMPALTEVKVNNCELSSLFFFGDLQQPESMKFSKLEKLTLVSLQSPTSFYRKKKEMDSISSVQFQPLFDGMVAFPSLNELIIQDLEITDIWGQHYSNDNVVSSSSFCKLKSLEVNDCSKLDSVIPVSMLDRLHNLEDLFIEDCSRLRNAFPPCIARDLIRLERMWISSCEMMTEIIGGADQQKEKDISSDHIIVFPELTKLELVNLKNLTNFWCYQGGELNTFTYKVQFPSLVKFKLNSCGVINLEAIELCRDDSTCPLKSISIKSENHLQLPRKWQLHLYTLEKLKLRHCWWQELKSLCFPELKELQVSNCGRCALFTISGFGSLQQLETLEISNCDLLEEIVEDVRGDGHDEMDKKTVIELLQLDSVILKDLPNLKSFTHGTNYECHMPALDYMIFDNCGLSSLFTCSVFRNLQQLDELVVSNCILLEAIVEDGRGDGETSDANDKIITLLKLYSITLEDLPHLSSFSCSESHAFNMPELKEFYLLKCPRLENLKDIKASTGIVSFRTEHGCEEVTDLNDFITKHRKRGCNLVTLQENQVGNQELETESGIIEEEKHQEG